MRQNDGYEFLFKDDIYLPVYKYSLRITKRKIIKLNLVEEKVLEIINTGVYQVDEIAKILGLSRRMLDITLADLHTRDLISVSSDICSLLKKGEQALMNLERVEKSQDIMKDLYMDALQGFILYDVSKYQMQEKIWDDDNKLQACILAEDLKQIKSKFEDIQDIFDQEYNQGELADGIKKETQELLTIDSIENVFVTFLRMPILVYVSNNGLDIDIIAGWRKYVELMANYKDEIIEQINKKKVLRNHFRTKKLREEYFCPNLEVSKDLFDLLKTTYYNTNLKKSNIKKLQSSIFSSRKLLSGEENVLLEYLASQAHQVILMVDNLDDWAYDRQFVGSLSRYVAKAKLSIMYRQSRDERNALKRLNQGHTIWKCEQCDKGFFICWQYDEEYEVFGIPKERRVLNDATVCVVVDYFLHKLKDI